MLGFYHVTHRALIAAITPIAIPTSASQNLNTKMIVQRRGAPYSACQLDGTAYPGSSGSPLDAPETGHVLGIINKVLVKGTKEAILTQPSGITYAISGKHIHELMDKRPLPSRP